MINYYYGIAMEITDSPWCVDACIYHCNTRDCMSKLNISVYLTRKPVLEMPLRYWVELAHHFRLGYKGQERERTSEVIIKEPRVAILPFCGHATGYRGQTCHTVVSLRSQDSD